MPYTPNESIALLKNLYRTYGADLWGPYGFYDAFNLNEDWFADSYIAIDQGPIIDMIENYRSELLWDMFMLNPEIQPALDAIGFTEDSTTAVEYPLLSTSEWYVYPTITDDVINISLPAQALHLTYQLTLSDVHGRVLSQQSFTPMSSITEVTLSGDTFLSGWIWVTLTFPGSNSLTKPIWVY